MTEEPQVLSDDIETPYNDWTVVFKSGAVLKLEGVALVRHTTGGSLSKITVTRHIPLGAEVAIDNEGNFELDLEEISGVFRATP